MANHSVYTFFSVHNCLDEDFDASDAMADTALCRAIVAGRCGVHPDAWGAHDPLSTLPPHYRDPFVPPVGYPGDRAVEWKPHKPKPKPRPKPVQRPHWSWIAQVVAAQPPPHGTLQLTCDVCERARFARLVSYSGDRPTRVAEIRAMGHNAGWTCIAGTDRCPDCSQAAAPKPVGNGAGGDQGDKQHA